MNSCKEYSEKIIFFDDLDDKEKQIIIKHLENCKDCQSNFEKTRLIMKSLKSELNVDHLDPQLLARYVIHDNFPDEADFDGERLLKSEVLKIQKHLRTCSLCQEKFEEMKVEFKEVETYLNETELANYTDSSIDVFINKITSISDSMKEGFNKLWSNPKQKFVFIPAAGLAIILIMFLLLPFFKGTGNMYYNLGKLENTEIEYLTRSVNVDQLQSGIAEFNNGNYTISIDILGKFILEHSDDPNLAFAHYVCGLSYLFQVNKILDNEIEPVRIQYLDKGIMHLKTVLSLKPNVRLRENSNWYLGKAYLLKEDGHKAIEYFRKVQKLKGRKYQKAQKIIIELEKNLISTK